MLREAMNGFFMAMADSVPGVSGGTVAFIMGFYDRFISSVNNLVFGNSKQRLDGIIYLAKLGVGWVTGMIIAVIALSSLFEKHIYTISSLFMGFIIGSIPLIIGEEKKNIKDKRGIIFLLIGALIVIGIAWINGKSGNALLNLREFNIILGIKMFFIGLLAISAMFLPGISGSTMLLIFGAYIPVITAVRGVLNFDIAYIPSLIFFGLGIVFGAAIVVKGIRVCLERYRNQSIYTIIGMMIGSLYAIAMGPLTLKVPMPAMGVNDINIFAYIIGVIAVIGLNKIKKR